MANIIQTRIKLRNDTLSNWSSSNIKIFKGEAALGYDATSGKYEIRIGTSDDGSTWTQLAGNNLTIPAANIIGLNNTQYDYQLVETEDGTIQLQKKLPTDQDWTNVGSAISLSFADGTDANGYSSSNPIALKDYVDEKVSDAVEALDTASDVGIASVSNNVVTIKGSVKEVDGVIAQGTASDVVLEEVAVTGAAADVSVAADATSGLTAGTVQGKLQELKTAIDNVDSDAAVTIDDSTTTAGYLKSYSFSQGGTTIGTINIPKDYLVKSGQVVQAGSSSDDTTTPPTRVITGATAGDKYLEFIINTPAGTDTDQPIYIAVNDLVDVYTGTTDATGITITVNGNNEISATCNISGSATIASVNNGVVTLKTGIAQASGAVSNDSGTDITLAKVATTGTATDVAITDSGSLLDSTNVEDALQEVAGKANTAVQTVTGETAISGGSDDYVSVSASKSGTTVTLDSKVKVQAVSTASSSATGLAEASDVKTYVDTQVAKKAEYLGTATSMPSTASVTTSDGTVTANKGDFITYSGAEYFWSGSAWLGLGKVDSVSFAGTTLTINNGTASITKAAALTALNVEDGAQVNVIETVKVGGTALTPDSNKAVDIDNIIINGGSATARTGFDVDQTASTGHADTRFTLEGGTVETHNITGTLDQQWMITNGYYDGNEWSWLKTITQADIGNTVTSIGTEAFSRCSGITSMTIPNSVESIGDNALANCDNLTSVTIPNSVTSIGSSAFYYCTNLTSVTIPDGVTSIGSHAFYGCNNLTSVTIVATGKPGASAENVKQMIITAINDASISDNITWNMPS